MKCEYWTKLSKMVSNQSVEGRSKNTLNHRSIDPNRDWSISNFLRSGSTLVLCRSRASQGRFLSDDFCRKQAKQYWSCRYSHHKLMDPEQLHLPPPKQRKRKGEGSVDMYLLLVCKCISTIWRML